jgi:hypothetical protein
VVNTAAVEAYGSLSNREGAISTFDELQELGHLGERCLRLIMELTAEELRRFPVLWTGSSFSADDAADTAGEFVVEKIKKVTANLLALATDDESVGRLLRTSIRHWLIDQARKTGVGSVRRSLEEALAADDAFEQTGPGARWRLAGTDGGPFDGDENELIRAAHSVPNVRIRQWGSSSRRPVVARSSVVAVCRAVLTAANGSLEIGQLVHVLLARFPVVLDSVTMPLTDVDGDRADAEPTPEELAIAAEDDLTAVVSAAEVVGMLTAEERRIVCHLHDAKAVQQELGCGRSTAYAHIDRLKDKLRQLAGEDNAVDVVRQVFRLCCGAPPV